MADAGRRDRRAERHEASKREIIDAAWSLARQRGLSGWTLRDLGVEVGMRAQSLYVYFASKNAIYDAMYAQGYEELLLRVRQIERRGDPLAVLRRAARTFFDFAVEDAARYHLLFLRIIPDFEPSERSYQLAKDALDQLAEALRDAGRTSVSDLDLWTAVLSGLATQQISNDPGGRRWRRLVDTAVDRFLA